MSKTPIFSIDIAKYEDRHDSNVLTFYGDGTYNGPNLTGYSMWKIENSKLFYRHEASFYSQSWAEWEECESLYIMLEALDIDREIDKFLSDEGDG